MKPPLLSSLGFLLFLSLTLQSCGKAPATPLVTIPLPTNTQTLPTLVAATTAPTVAEPTSTFTQEPTKIQPVSIPNVYQMDNTCAWGFNINASALPNVCSRK